MIGYQLARLAFLAVYWLVVGILALGFILMLGAVELVKTLWRMCQVPEVDDAGR